MLGGLSLGTFLSNRLNLQISTGLGVGGGLRNHWSGGDPDVRWSPYAGAHVGLIPYIEIEPLGSGGNSGLRPDVDLPVAFSTSPIRASRWPSRRA